MQIEDLKRLRDEGFGTEIMSSAEVYQELGLKPRTVQGWVKAGKFPTPIKFRGVGVGYIRQEVEEWRRDNNG